MEHPFIKSQKSINRNSDGYQIIFETVWGVSSLGYGTKGKTTPPV
jgi:hypothetical protein